MKLDYNVQMIGYGLFILAVFVAIVKVRPPSEKISRDTLSEGDTVKLLPKDCPKGSSPLPDKETKKFVSGNVSIFNRTGYGGWKLVTAVETDWNITSAQISFGFEYNDGAKRQIILKSDNIYASTGGIAFYFEGDQTKDLNDIKTYNFRIVSACGDLRPMKIEIKAKEAMKEAGDSAKKAIKGIEELFSR